jgi:acetyl-CoA C-acetyltransferase
MDVFIRGVGMTKFGKSDDSLEKMMAEAASLALRNAQLENVDAIYIGLMSMEKVVGESNIATLLADTIAFTGIPATHVETVSSTGAGALQAAFYAIASGHLKNILVLAGEKMTHLPIEKTTRILFEVIDRSERRYGATMPALAALIVQKYAQEFHLSSSKLKDILAQVAIKNHSNGSLNPYTQFRKIITKEDYLKGQMVSYPLRLYDCVPITDGASAIILTSQPDVVKVSGIGYVTDASTIEQRASITSFNSTREAALKAYSMAQINPSDIQFAEVHDAFTPFEIIGTEDLGFSPRGEGWKALEQGITCLRGRRPVNPSGGLKSRGHPIGASGFAQLVEIVWQLRGEAGAQRQLGRAEVGLAQSMDGLGNDTLVTILERSDRKRKIIEGWRPDYQQEIEVRKKKPPPPLQEQIGVLESFTVLYAPPEGFRSPLTIGLVKTVREDRVMACNPDYRSPRKLRMGRKVSLRLREGLYIFETVTFLNRFKQWIKRSSRPKGKGGIGKKRKQRHLRKVTAKSDRPL